ncbi:hypothetical protein C922_02502 [Plasmodium inui San Antonio 1]|uniref:Uncharacterized protein n=1 Tax=Plasmodium inui San Antonio 1 TaxID=1237626 RepID=W7A6Q6_9APIC|nr:hypothetical protein C922_02502 [Plasmodium inui San Antonio 1]EUD66918.1 hypothetical protein C922_02502 [Plasmodium inui San Antonio 1]
MKAPAFKPLCDVIRIKKREEDAAAGSELYKAFLNAGKKNEEELRNKSVKIVIYEHVKYEEEKRVGSSTSGSDSDGDSDFRHGCTSPQGKNKIDKKGRKKKDTQGEEHREAAKTESTDAYQVGNGRKKGAKDKGDPKETAKETTKAKAQGKEKTNGEGEPTTCGVEVKRGAPNGAKKKREDLQYAEKKEDSHKFGEKGKPGEKNDGASTQGEDTPNGSTTLTVHTQQSDVVKERKSSKVLGTVKILYNFYVNLFDKLKEDVENIQSGAANNNVDLFRDVNLYTNCISMFDIINLCEDLKIIKTFLNSKKECELIWILTVNYLDKVDVNLFERYKHKIDVTYGKDVPGRVKGDGNPVQTLEERSKEGLVQTSEEISTEETHAPGETAPLKMAGRGKESGKVKNNKSGAYTEEGSKEKKGKTQKGDIAPIGGEETNIGAANTSERAGNPPRVGQEVHNLKEYLYAKCHERKNAIMFRRVNFFVFLYVLIYIIKTSSRKIKSLPDDIKKVRSFFFFLNLYEKKKTIETLKNIYKDKYLTFFQNFKSSKEIEEYRRRKIFCHKFSFCNVSKILNQKGDDLVRLKEASTRGEKKQTGGDHSLGEEKQIERDHPLGDEKHTGEHNEEAGSYHLTNFVNTAELDSDFNSTSNPHDESRKESPPLLSPYLLDYIFKNYCYKKKHWKVKESAWINFGVVRKEEKKKYKMDIYNHTKFNISVDVVIDGDLPIVAIFKDKLFCVSSKYSIYLQVDHSKEGEWFGFVNISLRYKNATKGDDAVRIPVYMHICP